MSSGQRVAIDKPTNLSFQIGPHCFQGSFSIMLTVNNVLPGNIFFKKYKIAFDPKRNVHLPDLTVQLNQILPQQGIKSYYRETI